MEKKYMWIVRYSRGSWDDFVRINVFVTTDEEKAKAYCEKFNRILTKWKEYWGQIEETEYNFNRWNEVLETNNSYYDKIEIR